MNKYYYEGKTKEAAIELALQELKISDEDLVINNIEEKSGLLKKSVNTLLSLDAQINLLIGNPIFLAKKPAKILPKFPVGTTKFIFSPIISELINLKYP